ncbi:unnamed protein product [Mycena citricolor]|uniref:Major facilitator superfamily (MFS) profile domain-containing protein n=1 Tax=Mycena citricolor TaxID=2018698 RepID=A0AAD2GS37_9AGAR|nr:unnamed protein product [Mycena citricolor]CAK5275226.1 unnamed protein product [Mycena citricolor]
MASRSSSLTHVPAHDGLSVTDVDKSAAAEVPTANGHGNSAIPEDKKEEIIENLEDDWQDDERNPRNWTSTKKWVTTAVVSFYTFVSPLSSSIMAPGLPQIGVKYHITNETILSMTLSIFLISFAIGPLLFAPLSEMYGRRGVLNIMNVLSIAFSLGCAFAPNLAALLVFRFLLGFTGSAPVACGGGVISDLFSERDRAAAMAIYSLGPLIGPVVGPIAGGFITETIGVKYVFVLLAGLQALAAITGIPILQETYSPYIRLKLAKQSPDPEKAAAAHPALTQEHTSLAHYLWINVSRPAIMLFCSMICFLLSLYMAFMYGIYYLMFTVFSNLFTDTYGFNTGTNGLTYIGLGVGFLSATLFSAKYGNEIYIKLSEKNGGVGEPEMRIPGLVFGSIVVPIGLFWYGWSAQAKIHWIMPIIGSGIFGFGMMSTYLPIQLYLVDTFSYAASALSAASVFRSLFGFIFPLFGQQMYNALGQGGGNSLLAGLAIVLGIPFPIYLWFNGKRMRESSKLAR